MIETFPKSGKTGKPGGYQSGKSSADLRGTPGKSKDVGFHEVQGTYAKNPDKERVDMYALPGTSAAKRQGDPFMTSLPTSRYRSRRP